MVGWFRRDGLAAIAGGLAVLAGLAVASAAAEAPASPPERFVDELARQVAATLRDRSLTEPQRLARVDEVTAGAFDLDRTARIALGRHWKAAPESERRAFAALFKDYVLTSYGRRFRHFADRAFRVLGASPAGGDVVVASAIEGGGAAPMRLDWRLTPAADGWRVLDVVVEGVSLLVTFRNEFAAVIERGGGGLAGLLDELRDRVAAERALLAG
jgi:phospholipid transport system substrate-binding protein